MQRVSFAHRDRHSERLLNANEIVIHRVKRNRGGVVLDFS
jgi:hypothetical protein